MKDHLGLTTALINTQISLKANTRIFLDGEKLEISSDVISTNTVSQRKYYRRHAEKTDHLRTAFQ